MIKIRKAIPSDARAVKSAHYHAYRVSYRGYLTDEYLDNMQFDNAIIQRTADNIRSQEYYVAEQNGQVIGFAYLTYPAEKTFEIMALYVHPDFQKQGAGSALIKDICRRKKAEGYCKIILWTIKNGPSLGFYQKMGLTPADVPEKQWKCNLSIICLEKDL